MLLYELLTGKTPFETKRVAAGGPGGDPAHHPGGGASASLHAVEHHDGRGSDGDRPAAPHRTSQADSSVRGDLDWIVMRALEKDRARRYETANGLAMDIERHIQHDPIVARPASTAYRLQKFAERHKLLFAGVGAVAGALILGIIATTGQALRATRAEQQQSRLRAEAEIERQQAEAGAERAKAASTEARAALAAFNFSEANRLIEANHDPEAVAYLVRILSSDPDNRAALERLASLLTYHTWMIPTLALRHTNWVWSAQFSPDGQRIVDRFLRPHRPDLDAQTGLPLTRPLPHRRPVNSRPIQPGWPARRHRVRGQHRAGVGCADRPARGRAVETHEDW